MIHGNKELGYNYKNNETNIRKYIIYINYYYYSSRFVVV